MAARGEDDAHRRSQRRERVPPGSPKGWFWGLRSDGADAKMPFGFPIHFKSGRGTLARHDIKVANRPQFRAGRGV